VNPFFYVLIFLYLCILHVLNTFVFVNISIWCRYNAHLCIFYTYICVCVHTYTCGCVYVCVPVCITIQFQKVIGRWLGQKNKKKEAFAIKITSVIIQDVWRVIVIGLHQFATTYRCVCVCVRVFVCVRARAFVCLCVCVFCVCVCVFDKRERDKERWVHGVTWNGVWCTHARLHIEFLRSSSL